MGAAWSLRQSALLGAIFLVVSGYVAASAYRERLDTLGRIVHSIGDELLVEKNRKAASLKAFVTVASVTPIDSPYLRQAATSLGTAEPGWFIISRPGPRMIFEFSSFGDGTLPPTLPRTSYPELVRAELEATATSKPALSDVFIGTKSKVPAISLVAHATLPAGKRMVYLRFPVSVFDAPLRDFAPPDVSAVLLDTAGTIVAGHGEDQKDRSLPYLTMTDEIFPGWQLVVTARWLDAALVIQSLASGLIAVALAMLSRPILLTSFHRRSSRTGTDQTATLVDPLREQLALALTLGHELRSPLISMLSAIDAIRRTPDRHPAAALEHATREAHHLLRLIDDLLSCAKLSHGQIVVSEDSYLPAQLMAQCIETVSHSVDPQTHFVLTHTGPGDFVLGDVSKIRQILLNFLNNAAKYSGSAPIACSVRTESIVDGMISVEFAVSDQGPGMPVELTKRLFHEVGVKTGHYPKAGNSNGLGLVTSRLLAEAMGGQVGVSSHVGVGSSFWFRLTQRRASPSAARLAVPTRPLAGLRIAVAEDDPIMGLLIEEDLTEAGATVCRVADGASLVALCEGESFDLVITDERMPVMGGREAARTIRTLGREMPRILSLTAHLVSSDERDPDTPFDAVLEKPFSLSKLLNALDGKTPRKTARGLFFDEEQAKTLFGHCGDKAQKRALEVAQSFETELARCDMNTSLDEVGEICHRMAGLASTVGLRGLAETLLEIERSCLDDDTVTARRTLAFAKDALPGQVEKLLGCARTTPADGA